MSVVSGTEDLKRLIGFYNLVVAMIMLLLRIGVAWCVLGMTAVSAGQQRSVFDLVNQIPEVPSKAKDALTWFDREGRLIQHAVLALKDEIEQARKQSQLLAEAAGGNESEASLILGMEHVDIDAARLQTDPVYSADMKRRLQQMTVEERMALAQKMLEPQEAARQRRNRLTEKELQAVSVAVAYARQFPERKAAWQTGKRGELVEEFESVPRQVPPQPVERVRPSIESHAPECDTVCAKRWEDYRNEQWTALLDRETMILHQRRDVLQRYKTFLAEEFMREGHTQLQSTLYGTLALNQDNRVVLAHFHQSLLDEILGLIDLTEAAAKRAAEILYGESDRRRKR